MNPLPVVESITALEGEPERDSTAGEWAAWAIRRRLPSELAHKVALRWPADVTDLTGIPEQTLKAHRAAGDHPRLYAIGRALFTTRRDVEAWLQQHALEHGQLVRPATVPRGTRRARREVAA
ncbi:hypothetical protein [Azohydromonas sp.]|uniref:hypothetical protein n=1 Tax=Azohydromonas sp. TaxID=1872666 RepID=UPI002B6E0F08|nr:hypothetical protein [Azohydromonas sp.]HMM83910.1 hypothetical protein [Azohydromonas sp.]